MTKSYMTTHSSENESGLWDELTACSTLQTVWNNLKTQQTQHNLSYLLALCRVVDFAVIYSFDLTYPSCCEQPQLQGMSMILMCNLEAPVSLYIASIQYLQG